MVPYRFVPGFITSVLQRFAGGTVRRIVGFSDAEIVEMLDVLADDLKRQRPSAYVLTERLDTKSQRFVTLRTRLVGENQSVMLFNGYGVEQWGVYVDQFTPGVASRGDVTYLTTPRLVSFLRDNGYDPERAYANMVESAIRVMYAKVADYTERLGGLHTMLANVRIHEARSILLSRVASETLSVNTKP